MIGQTEILKTVDSWIETNNVPRCIVITGGRRCGKTYLAKQIARRMKAYLIDCQLSVDAVREAVQNCYKCSGTTVYLFDNADRMSTAAKNALLKITEEPPRQAHFILTCDTTEHLLPTITSRSTVLQMAPYSKDELDELYRKLVHKHQPIIREICDAPGLFVDMQNTDVTGLIDFCYSIVDNVRVVTGVNAFKITQRVRIKEDGPGYDPELFFYCMKFAIYRRIMEMRTLKDIDDSRVREDLKALSRMLDATFRCHRDFNATGVKKDATLDMWILEMREC